MAAEIPLVWFNAFSLAAGFAATFLAFEKPKSMLFTAALGILLFILLGVFALPGFLMALGARVLLKPQPVKADKKAKARGKKTK